MVVVLAVASSGGTEATLEGCAADEREWAVGVELSLWGPLYTLGRPDSEVEGEAVVGATSAGGTERERAFGGIKRPSPPTLGLPVPGSVPGDSGELGEVEGDSDCCNSRRVTDLGASEGADSVSTGRRELRPEVGLTADGAPPAAMAPILPSV